MTADFTPSPVANWMRRIRGWDWQVIAFILGLKVLLFTFAVEAAATASEDWSGDWMEIWNRWDAVHYLALAQDGYSAVGEDRVRLAFFPLYPMLVRSFEFLTRDFLAAAFVVSGFASIAAAFLLKKLTLLDEKVEIANAAVFFLFIFPTSYFLHIPYTESLFLSLALGCFLAARTDRWFTVGLLGALACLTRVNGLMLLPALAFEVFSRFQTSRRFEFRWLWLCVVPLGFLVYLSLNYRVTGDFFAFMQIQHEHWYKQFTPPWIGIRELWLRVLEANPMEGLHEFFWLVLATLCTVWCWFVLRPSYAIWMTCNLLLVTSTSFVLSVPRFTLTFFPIFILCARACAGRKFLGGAVTIFCLLYLGLYAGRFVRGLWAF